MIPDVLTGLPLTGKKISLTAIKQDDMSQLEEFFNHIPSLIYYLPTTVRPYNQTQLEKLISEWNDGESCFVFAVRSQENLIGLINLDDIDWVNSHAEVGIALTDISARGHGYAAEALKLMIDYAFNSLGLHKLWARIIEGNKPSISLFEKSGFLNEGTMREQVLRNGEWKSMLLYGLINN